MSNFFAVEGSQSSYTVCWIKAQRLCFLSLLALPRSLREGLETPVMNRTPALIQGRYPTGEPM